MLCCQLLIKPGRTLRISSTLNPKLPLQECVSQRASPVESTDLPWLGLHEPLLNLGAMLVGVAAKLNSSTITVAEGKIHHTPAVTPIPDLGCPVGTPLQQKHKQ